MWKVVASQCATKFTVMKVNPVLDELGAHGVAAVQQRARDLRAAGKRIIDFSIGDPREATPEMIPKALVAAVPVVSQYPTTKGLAELRVAIADYVGRRFGVEVDPDTQVMPTSGSKEAIFSSPLAFVDRDRDDLITWPTPGYPIYERGARLAGARGNAIRLTGDFAFRPDMVSGQAWDESVMLWTCSPHNPAGTVMDRDTVRRFVERARDTETWLCADECYVDLYEGERPSSVLEFAGAGSPGVLSFLSLSKRSGMTGYRSGAVVGDADAIGRLAALRVATGTASPEFVQAAAIAAWSDDEHATVRRRIFTDKRRVLKDAFAAAGLEVVGSEAGLYIWMRVDDDVAATASLLDHGVVVSPGRAFGPGGEGYIRLALVPTLEECAEAAEAVVRCLT
jgi:acetylornithine aminotransferase